MDVRPLAPPLLDSNARGAPYLTAVALSFQPAWHQFLEDCRLRLSADHPLNQLSLAATAELAIGKRGEVRALRIGSSGNRDFDHAIEQLIGDVAAGSVANDDARELGLRGASACGAAFELGGSYLRWLQRHGDVDLDDAVRQCGVISSSAKALQFKAARAAGAGRAFDPAPLLQTMADAWDGAMRQLDAACGALAHQGS